MFYIYLFFTKKHLNDLIYNFSHISTVDSFEVKIRVYCYLEIQERVLAIATITVDLKILLGRERRGFFLFITCSEFGL